MHLEGSCQCGRVRFSVESDTPYPYQLCFCSICRKTTGGAFGCNIMARRDTLELVGRRYLRRYHAVVRKGARSHKSEAWRVFCGACGTHLWLEDKRWPEGIWPNAGAIDTKLPVPPSYTLIMTRYKPEWIPLPKARAEQHREYPEQSIADWHRQRRLRG
jgi:hypothetical protein